MTDEQIEKMAEHYHKEIGIYSFAVKLDDSNGYYRQKGFNYTESVQYHVKQQVNRSGLFKNQTFEFVEFTNKVYFENAWYIEVKVKFTTQPT